LNLTIEREQLINLSMRHQANTQEQTETLEDVIISENEADEQHV